MQTQGIIKPYFDKEATDAIKGIAIVIMFIHHFFTFPSFWIEGVNYPLFAKYAVTLSLATKICVACFCFLSGYLYFFCKCKDYKYSIRKISDILINYWTVFLIGAVIAIAFADYSYSVREFIKDGLALSYTTLLFGWYVNLYVSIMILMPILSKLLSKNIIVDILIIGTIPVIMYVSNCFITSQIVADILVRIGDWLPVFLIGYLFASYDLFTKINSLNKRIIRFKLINIIVWVALMLGVLVARSHYFRLEYGVIGFNMDVIYAPLFLYALINIIKALDLKALYKIIRCLGKRSLLMWFVSCLFFSNSKSVLQPILYFPKNPALVLIWGLLLCFVISYLLDILISKLINWKNSLLFN
ncbi:MAG: acyltransferase [Saccharofermentans sp.]|nr:acyltransferase [Saccharofermentans sp.]